MLLIPKQNNNNKTQKEENKNYKFQMKINA